MKRRKGYLTAGLALTGLLALWMLMGQFWTPYDPTAIAVGPKLSPPSLAHLLGTDNLGRDVFSRVWKGAGATAAVALCTVVMGALCGVTVGALTGYFGGWVDGALTRLNDALTAFPSILLALVALSLLGPEERSHLVLALSLAFIPGYARISRTAYASLRETNYAASARLMGVRPFRLLVVHLLPNTLPSLLPALTIGFNNAVLAEASMSYLGIGVSPADASLGYMLSEAQSCFSAAPWYALGTGATIVLLVFGVGLIGQGLQAGDKGVG